MNGIIRMLIRSFMRIGVRRGIDWYFKNRADKEAQNLTPEQEKEMRAQNRQQAQSAKRGYRILRRFTRF